MNTNRMTMKEARENSGMTLSAACAAMQISRSKLLSWESGRSLPAADEAIRMATAYGINLNDIDFSRTDSKRITFDTSALRARILQQYDSIDQFAKIVGMTGRTLNSRLDNHTEFCHNEIGSIRDALNLNADEVTRLFFMPDDADRKIADVVMKMNDNQRDLLIQIMQLVKGHPARMEYARNYTGRMKDLPAALAQI